MESKICDPSILQCSFNRPADTLKRPTFIGEDVSGGSIATNNKPANTLRCGNIKATIWQNVSEKGSFYSTAFSRPFKDQSGACRNGTSFGLSDLEALVTVAREATLAI